MRRTRQARAQFLFDLGREDMRNRCFYCKRALGESYIVRLLSTQRFCSPVCEQAQKDRARLEVGKT